MEINKKIIGIVAVCAIVVIGIVYASVNQEKSEGEFGTVDHQTKEEIEKRAKKKADSSVLVASVNQEIILDTGDSEGLFNIENLPENTYDINVEFLRNDKQEEKIYESGMMKPGFIIRKDKLDQKLKKGSYLCVARVLGYDEEGKHVMTVDMQIHIIVKK